MLPYEMGMVFDLDHTRTQRTVTLIGSPRHFGPLFMFMFANAEAFPADEIIKMPGIDDWEPDTFTRDGDAILLVGTGAVSESARQLAAERWPEPAMPAVLLENGHCIEFVVSNRSGEAYLALEPFLTELAKNEQTQPSGAPPIPDESNPKAAPEPESGVSSDTIFREFLLNMEKARLIADFVNPDTLRFRLEAESGSVEFPESAKPLIESAIQSAYGRDLPEYLQLNGKVTVDGSRILADYDLTGFHDHLVSRIRSGMQ
jgi:hypothetical protein